MRILILSVRMFITGRSALMTLGFDLGFSPRQRMIRDQLHAVARNDLRARAAETETEGLDLKVVMHHLDTAGIGPATLLEHGIDGYSTLLTAVEELAYGDAGIGWAAVPALQIAVVLNACGTEAQRQLAGEAFARDEAARASVLLYEDFGRQPSEYETTARRSGDQWLVSGRKSSVAHPADADVSLLVARDRDRDRDSDSDSDELAAFSFVGTRPGMRADRNDRDTGKIAINSVPGGPVSIDDLSMSTGERLVGGLDLHRAIGQARLMLAAALIGLSRASLEFCSAYAVQRTTWGTPIAKHQGVSFPLVELATEVEEVRLLLWDTAASLDRTGDTADIERQVSRAVNRASSLGMRATRDGVQLVGVRAITRDLPCERWYRQAAVLGALDFDVLATPFGLS
jgi:alkylation response protein AidB-like acyl-CoA dehydrogenase